MKKRNLLLATALIALSTIVSAFAEPIYFAQISDTHWGMALHQWRFRKGVEIINNLPFPLECVVHTGDLSSNTLVHDSTAAGISNIFAMVKAPRLIVPGNHDVQLFGRGNRDKNFLSSLERFQRFFGPLAQEHITSNAVYLAVTTETIRRDGAPQVEGFDPLKWLDEHLAANADKPAFIFTHVPDCDDFYGNEIHPGWDSQSARAAFREVIGRHKNVKAVIGGHFHRNVYEAHPDGVPTIAGPCIATFWQRQGAIRFYVYNDGCLSYQDIYIEDPAKDVLINHDGFIVEPEVAID